MKLIQLLYFVKDDMVKLYSENGEYLGTVFTDKHGCAESFGVNYLLCDVLRIDADYVLCITIQTRKEQAQ